MSHYFDDVFARGKTGRRSSVTSVRHHIRRSSTARSIGARSDFDTDVNGTEAGNSLGNSGYLDDPERERERNEADEHMHQYISDQLARYRDDQGAETYFRKDEYEAQG